MNTTKYWSQMTHEERLESVKEQAEIYRKVTGSIESTCTDGDYTATARKNGMTTVTYQGVVVA